MPGWEAQTLPLCYAIPLTIRDILTRVILKGAYILLPLSLPSRQCCSNSIFHFYSSSQTLNLLKSCWLGKNVLGTEIQRSLKHSCSINFCKLKQLSLGLSLLNGVQLGFPQNMWFLILYEVINSILYIISSLFSIISYLLSRLSSLLSNIYYIFSIVYLLSSIASIISYRVSLI